MSASLVDLIVLYESIASGAAAVVFLALAAYNSFLLAGISREHLFRNQAIWTGLLASGLIGLLATALLTGGSPSSPSLPTKLGVFVYFTIMGASADSMVRTAIDRDYFHRDTLHWSIVRYPFLIFVGFVFPFIAVESLGVTGPVSLLLLFDILFIASVTMVATGVAALFVSRGRTNDKCLRSQMKWLAFATLSFVLQFSFPLSYPFSLRAAIPIAFAAFFLFKMAKSLSPLDKFEIEDSGDHTVVEGRA